MDDMIIPMLQARTGRDKIVKPVNAQRQRNPHGQQTVIALKHDRDLPKCWMGYITIDLLGKDSVDGVKQIASTSALPARTDTSRFKSNRPVEHDSGAGKSMMRDPPPYEVFLPTLITLPSSSVQVHPSLDGISALANC